MEGRGGIGPYAQGFENATCVASCFHAIVMCCAEPYGFHQETMSIASTLVQCVSLQYLLGYLNCCKPGMGQHGGMLL